MGARSVTGSVRPVSDAAPDPSGPIIEQFVVSMFVHHFACPAIWSWGTGPRHPLGGRETGYTSFGKFRRRMIFKDRIILVPQRCGVRRLMKHVDGLTPPFETEFVSLC